MNRAFRHRLFAYIAIMAFVLTAVGFASAQPLVPSAENAFASVSPIYFSDLSSNNGLPSVVKFSDSLVSIKVNESTGYVWTAGEALADQLHAKGVEDIHYDFIHPGYNQYTNTCAAATSAGRAEASVFVAASKAHWRKGDHLAADLEVADWQTDAGITCFMTGWFAVAETLDPDPIVYGGWYWYADAPGRPKTLALVEHRPFWLAAYQASYPVHTQLTDVVAWQYTNHAWLASCSCYTDRSVLIKPTFFFPTATPKPTATVTPSPSPTKAPAVVPFPGLPKRVAVAALPKVGTAAINVNTGSATAELQVLHGTKWANVETAKLSAGKARFPVHVHKGTPPPTVRVTSGKYGSAPFQLIAA